MRTALLLGVLLTPVTSVAQTWAVTAQAPVAGTALASTNIYPLITSQPATLPAGPVPAGPFLACTVGGGATHAVVGADWSPSVPGQVAPLAFAASCTWGCGMNVLFGVATASLQADIDLLLQAPQATSGRLRLHVSPNQPSPLQATHTVDVDVGADGIVDYRASTQQADLALQIPANGVVVRVSLRIAALVGSGTGFGSLGVTAEFFPGEPVLSVFDTTGAGASLTWQQTPGQMALTLGEPTTTPLLMAFGTQPLSIPVLPTVTVLVTLDVLLATGSVTLPAVSLPPGSAFYVQGLVLDATNTLRSSNSVRLYWP